MLAGTIATLDRLAGINEGAGAAFVSSTERWEICDRLRLDQPPSASPACSFSCY
jgi:hypothetical protein